MIGGFGNSSRVLLNQACKYYFSKTVYELLQDRIHQDAEFLLRNTRCTVKEVAVMFPTSDNALDSYAESLLVNGKRKEAELMYQKALEINPKNESSKAALEKVRK